MRKNRKIIDIAGGDAPIIYIRCFKNQIIYIGETSNAKKGRPMREDTTWEVDKVIPLKACKNKQRRMYWEAYLICKLKPLAMKASKYKNYLLNRNGKKIDDKDKEEIKRFDNEWTQRAFENLEKITKRTNISGSLYWKRQTFYAMKHMDDSWKMWRHFEEDEKSRIKE